MPKKIKKYKTLSKAEQKLAKYKRDLLTSSTAVELAPDITNLLSGLFDKGGLIAEPYRPQSPKSKRKPAKPISEPYRPSKEEVDRIFKRFPNIKRSAGGSVTVPTKLGRTKKTKMY